MIVPIAIGAFVVAFIFDIAALATGASRWFELSYWALLVGVIAGLLAAVTGLYDYATLRMSGQARQTATAHMVLNVMLMTLFIISLFLKREYVGAAGPVPDGRIVSTFVLDLIAVVLLLVSGWLGGEVVYRHGVAVMEEAASELQPQPTPGTTPVMGTLGGERPGDTEDPEQQG